LSKFLNLRNIMRSYTKTLMQQLILVCMYSEHNKSLKVASLDSLNRRMLRILRAACVCPLAQR
jgi:hypothetical protein